ncbi:MAG: sulfurtransferase TusA family protein [Rhodospirillales bacterium]|nr:sulfurtransferase TusA family protein [Rhodospirillales bacterium]
MNKEKPSNESGKTDFFLDITPETCPMTFVRTKLMIEQMSPGDIAVVILKGAEPLENVPRSVQDMGHSIISLEPLEAEGEGDGVYSLRILKT